MKKLIAGVFTLGAFWLAEDLLAQCAMCKTALIQSPEGQQMARGFNTGILFLLVMPYLLFATVGLAVWWTRRTRPAPREIH